MGQWGAGEVGNLILFVGENGRQSKRELKGENKFVLQIIYIICIRYEKVVQIGYHNDHGRLRGRGDMSLTSDKVEEYNIPPEIGSCTFNFFGLKRLSVNYYVDTNQPPRILLSGYLLISL